MKRLEKAELPGVGFVGAAEFAAVLSAAGFGF